MYLLTPITKYDKSPVNRKCETGYANTFRRGRPLEFTYPFSKMISCDWIWRVETSKVLIQGVNENLLV